MCLSDCCRCSASLSKSVHVISVIDLFTSIIFVTYEASNFGILTGIIEPLHLNCSVENCTLIKDYISTRMSFDFETWTVFALVTLILFGYIIEGILYSKLRTGRREKIHFFCKKWFEIRVALLMATVLMAVAKALRGFYFLHFDGVIDGITKTYRVISLYVVKCFMRELEDTVGKVYIKPPKPRKRGSLSLK